MFSNSTSILNTANSCAFTIEQLQLHSIALELSFYLLALLGVCFPLSVLSTLLALIALCSIRGWRNSARTYYYVIGVANFIAALSTDWLTFQNALASWAARWFPSGMTTVMALHWEILWPPLCVLYHFVPDVILLPKILVIVLFCLHRTWIVFDPFRAPLLKRVFRPALIVGLPVGFVVFYTPHFWLSIIVNGKFTFSHTIYNRTVIAIAVSHIPQAL